MPSSGYGRRGEITQGSAVIFYATRQSRTTGRGQGCITVGQVGPAGPVGRRIPHRTRKALTIKIPRRGIVTAVHSLSPTEHLGRARGSSVVDPAEQVVGGGVGVVPVEELRERLVELGAVQRA
jgi:hypothetical protein